MKRWKTILMGLLCISLLSVPVLAAPSAWAAAEVDQAIQAEFVPKELQSNYQEPITRAEFAKMAVTFVAKKLGYTTEEFLDYCKTSMPGQTLYTDTNDPYILAATFAQIVNGPGDGTFGPDRNITRQEAAVMLSRTQDAHSKMPSDYASDLWEKFSSSCRDASDVDAWATEGVARLYQYGIMRDVGGNVYAPQEPYTREQSIVTFLRMEKNLPDSGSGQMDHKRTQEEVIAALSEEINFRELLQRWDTPSCVILHTAVGTGHGFYDSLNVVFPNGAAPDVIRQLPMIDPRSGQGKYPEPNNIRISDDQTTLLFDVEGTYREYANNYDDTDFKELPYANTYSVDLATGLLTPLP